MEVDRVVYDLYAICMQKFTIIDSIRDDIIKCELKPGDALSEVSLASRYDCGRTKIRDALLVLQTENFVIHEANKGAHVAAMDSAQVYSMFEMRIALEKAAIVLAARRLNRSDHDQLQLFKADIGRAKDTDDEELFYKIDPLVHGLIAEASLNHFISQQIDLMRLHTRRSWFYYHDRGLEEYTDYDGLIEIIDSVCAKDPVRASQAMFAHLSHFHEAFSKMLSQQVQGLEHL